MTVTGIKMRPADALAIAPVVMFAMLDSFGSEDDECWVPLPGTCPIVADGSICDDATCCRNELRVVKYRAEPNPVLTTEGSVPLQSCLKALGPDAISCKLALKEVERDCWTRVLSRSAGWRRAADRVPVERPAKK